MISAELFLLVAGVASFSLVLGFGAMIGELFLDD